MNRRALLLSSVMARGHGVSVVADQIQQRISRFGCELFIGAMHIDEDYKKPNIFRLDPNTESIRRFCAANQIEAVIAQTSPYFEVLSGLGPQLATIAFEHGDPTPSFFDSDAKEREQIRLNKITNTYPNISRVICSSHFLRHDIGWPSADVIYLAADHVPDLGPKSIDMTTLRSGNPIRVGTLIRLGQGESRYKGNTLFRSLIRRLREEVDLVPFVMGKGTEDDAVEWLNEGITPLLNATDSERAEYLRDLDVFISPSQWEGFNLPVLEASALGTASLAFDVGAHPETAPYLLRDLEDAVELITAFSRDRAKLDLAARASYRFARTRFTWDETARRMAEVLVGSKIFVSNPVPPENPVVPRKSGLMVRLVRMLRREGVIGVLRTIGRRVTNSIGTE